MATEKRRGCGFRRVGGLYLMADHGGEPCDKMPVSLACCPTCGGGLKQSRGFTWAHVAILGTPCDRDPFHCTLCPVCQPDLVEDGRFALLWVGAAHYRTPEAFLEEGREQGFSKRIGSWPADLEPGRTWIGFAHPAAVRSVDPPEPGLFHFTRSTRLELIVSPSVREDDWVKRYEERGAVLVEVPDEDPDHSPRMRTIARTESMRKLAGAVQVPDEEE